ncbi:MAG: hypothetical protein M3219_02615 [Thermoproteota archaeon]|nr:hypothetical protein [Thermoproteota archaeon]
MVVTICSFAPLSVLFTVAIVEGGNGTAYIGRRYDSNITKNCLKSIDSAAATWMQVMNHKKCWYRLLKCKK